jgi:hypothetical protein
MICRYKSVKSSPEWMEMTTYIPKNEITHVANEAAMSSARERNGIAPEHPLHSTKGHDSNRLENHRKRGLPACQAAVQQANPRNDNHNENAHNHLVHIVEFKTDVRSVDISADRIPAIWVVGVKNGEVVYSDRHLAGEDIRRGFQKV